MLKPFYQGKLDVFCAIYAVLNGLRLTHKLRTIKAREIFADTLMNFCLRPLDWHDILTQQTDYIPLVDEMLAKIREKYPLDVQAPFTAKQPIRVEDIWQTCERWLNVNGAEAHDRAIVFRFIKYPALSNMLVLRHWTAAYKIDKNVMQLFDSSHDAESILRIHKEHLELYSPEAPSDKSPDPVLHIQPSSMRFLRLPF